MENQKNISDDTRFHWGLLSFVAVMVLVALCYFKLG